MTAGERSLLDEHGHLWMLDAHDGLRVRYWVGPGAELGLELTIPLEEIERVLERTFQ